MNYLDHSRSEGASALQNLYPAVSEQLLSFDASLDSRPDRCHKALATMIWQQADDSLFQSAVKSCTDLCKKCINAPLTDWKLTPFLVAVMAGDVTKASILSANGAKVGADDYAGNNARHHAAMRADGVMMDWLEGQGVSARKKNSLGGTYEDIKIWTRYSAPDAQDSGVPACDDYSRRVASAVDEAAAATFDQVCVPPSGQIVGDYVFKPRDLTREWELKPGSDADGLLSDKMKAGAAYRNLNRTPAATVVKPSEQLPVDATRPNEVPCGLFANREFKAGEAVAEYFGEFSVDSASIVPDGLDWKGVAQWLKSHGHDDLVDQDTTYALENFDSKRFRSAAAAANDGFPNAIIISATETGGRLKRPLLMAIEPISSGEEIVWDYGYHYGGKVGPYTVLRSEEMREFVTENSLVELAAGLNLNPSLPYDRFLEQMALLGWMIYIFQTPAAALELIGQGLISSDEIRDIFVNTQLPKMIGGGWGGLSLAALHSVAKTVETVRQYDEEAAPKVVEAITTTLHLMSNEHRHHVQLKWAHDLGSLFYEINHQGEVFDAESCQRVVSNLPKRIEKVAELKPEVLPMAANMALQDAMQGLIREAGRNPVWV